VKRSDTYQKLYKIIVIFRSVDLRCRFYTTVTIVEGSRVAAFAKVDYCLVGDNWEY